MKYLISPWRSLALVSIILAGPGCQSVPEKTSVREVRIAAAADLQYALEDLIAGFKQSRPEMEVKVTYGASGSLFAQISNRAPFDMFLSADLEYPQKLVEEGLAVKD